MPDQATLPTDSLDTLTRGATGSKVVAALLRWLAACAIAFASLLLFAMALSTFERTGAAAPAQTSAAAYLDFDLSLLRRAADGSLGRDGNESTHRLLLAMWSHRPDWQLPGEPREPARLVPLADAWTAAVSEKSRFRNAARGAGDALPFLVGALAAACVAAAIGGVLAQLRRAPRARWAGSARLGYYAGIYLLVAHPLWPLLDAAAFHDRTRSLGTGFSALLFVAAFAGTLSGAAARALFAQPRPVPHLSALAGRPALFEAARLAVLDAAEWLVPLVPALAAAALFVRAKADQDPALSGVASGLGALIRAALQELSAAERLSSCALVAGALVLLWVVGHRFVVELRRALGANEVVS
jgi:hypothetical protein